MFIERIWKDNKKELFNLTSGTAVRMYEKMAVCFYLEVEVGGKAHVLLENESISIIGAEYDAIRKAWVGDKEVITIEE